MHYKDGTEANVGDLVKGTTYNKPGVHVGVMLGITPGPSTCNCRVGILQTKSLPEPLPAEIYQLFWDGKPMSVHREFDGSDLLYGATVDYSQCDHLELVHRPE